MRELLAAAAGVIARRFQVWVVVVVALVIPLESIVFSPVFRAVPLSTLAAYALYFTDILLVAIFLTDLQDRPLSSFSIAKILSATLRVLLAMLIAILIALPLILLLFVSRSTIAFTWSFVVLGFVFAPFLLVMPISLSERGGPWWSLKRAWRLSRTRRGQVWILVGTIFTLGFVYTAVLDRTGVVSVAVHVILASATSIAQAALLAVVYTRLTAEESAMPTSKETRRPEQAAAGTFRESRSHRTSQKRRRR